MGHVLIALIASSAVAIGLTVVVVSLLLMLRSERARHDREQAWLRRQNEDLLDRNMHLTDGGAFGAGKSYRPTVRDDEPLDPFAGIIRDPENGVPDYDFDLAEEGAL